MRYEVGRFHRPMRRSTEGQLVGLVGLGDGSTLSLDFTAMSGLDSRFTFSRAGNATFINSSGLVQYADHNFWFNTRFDGISGTDPTLTNVGWQYFFSVGSCVFNGDGSVTISTASGTNRRALARTTSLANTTLRLAAAIDVVADTGATYGTLTVADIFTEGSVNDVQFYVDGTAVASSTVISGPCTVTWVFEKTGGGTVTPCFGINVRAAKSGAFALRFARPRFGMWGGVAPFPYFENTSSGVSASAYHAPRFDHDPATLAPKGLLIEGGATNVLENFGSSGLWGRSNIDGSGAGGVLANGQTGPDGVANTAARITTAATTTMTNMSVSRATNAAGNTRTFSVWLRGVGANTTASIAINGSNTPTGVASSQAGHAVTLTTSTSGNNLFGLVTGLSITAWTRVSISRTDTQASPDAYRICPGDHNGTIASGLSLDVYVPQAESGIGMTSTIPTGSGTVQRATDICSMTGSNFSSWYGSPTAFSMLFEGIAQINQNYGRVLCLSSGANTASGIPNFNLGFPAAASNRPFMNAYVVSNNDIDTYVPLGGALTNGIPFKIGFRHQTSSHYITRGTSLGAANSYAGFAAGLANLYFGNTDGTIHRSVHYTRLKFWPSALSNAQLDAFAT